MKFTKEQAFESLKRELTNNDRKTLRMSTKSLDKLTDTLISEFADDEIGLPDFCTKAMTILSVFNDNVGKDKSDFVKQWEIDHPTEPKGNPEPPKAEDNPEIKALMERIAALESDKKESEKKASIAQKKKDIISKLKEKGVKDNEWIDNFISEVNISEDLDVDAKSESWVKLYNKSVANGGNAVPPANPNGGAANSEYLKAIQAAGSLAKQERAIIETK